MKLSAQLAAAVGIPLALLSTACSPSPEDIAARQAATATLVDRADDCPSIAAYRYGQGDHHRRLDNVLAHTSTGALRDLATMRVTVCMDTGLAGSDDQILGVFHDASRMVRLADNGSDNNLAPETLNDLVYRLNNGKGGDAVALQQSRLVMVKPIIFRQAPNWYASGEIKASIRHDNANLLQAPTAGFEVASP